MSIGGGGGATLTVGPESAPTPTSTSVTETITLDAYSPLIEYVPAVDNRTWFDGASVNDEGLESRFNNGTFMFSDKVGASATLRFTGTGVRIVGSNTVGVSGYTIAFDGETNPPNRTENDTSPGVPTDPEDNFGYVLFDNLDLVDHGDHTVVIANAAGDSSEGGRNVTYIDYMLFSTEIPGIVSDVVIDDSDEAFSYSQEGWVADRTDQGTVHYTTTRNASATLTFQGTRVILYGTVGSTGSPYSILIRSPDVGGSGTNPGWSGEFNGTRPGFGYRPGEILFYKDDLANGTYEMTITALQDGVANTSSVANVSGSNPLQTLSIDYAIVDGYASGALAPVSSPSGGLSKKLSNQDIAGIVIGGVGALVIIGAAICWILYRGCCGRRILGGSGRSGRHKVRRTRSNASLGLEIQPFSFDPVSLRSVPDVARQPSNFDMKKRRDSGESGHTSDDSYADDPTVEGYPAERERLKQEVAAREASRAEAEAIEPLPTYQYQV